MKRQTLLEEMRLGVLNGLFCYAGVVGMMWTRHWLGGAIETVPTRWLVLVGIGIGVAIIFVRNIKQSPKRIGFAAVRTLAQVFFGVAAPAAMMILGLLAAPHGMTALPRVGPILGILIVATMAGVILIRTVVLPRR